MLGLLPSCEERGARPERRVSHGRKRASLLARICGAGGFVRYHCHGPIDGILDDMLALGVDMTDPCEAPPSGEVTLRQLAERVGRNLVLMGNIQLDDIERAEPDKIDRLVGEAVEAVGGRATFILCPTAFPFSSPLPAVTERYLIQFLTSGEKYGS
jgi:hypothetical protein